MDRIKQGWIGIDAGKGHHHAVLIDRDGQRLLSRRVINDQPDLVALIDTVRDRVVDPVWMIDLAGGSASLLIALLLQHGQRVVYLPGRAVNSGLSRLPGEGKTDAKDAAIIADQARMRRDLRELHVLDEDIAQLQLLSSYRADLAADRTRSINRLPQSPRRHLSCPGTSAGLHSPRPADPHQRLSNPDSDPPAGCCSAGVAEAARSPRRRPACPRRRRSRQPAKAHVPGQAAAASLIVRLAQTVLDLNRQLSDLDREVAGIFRTHDDAAIITKPDRHR